jgi:hypothetical protein
MSTTKEERRRQVANMLANFQLEGGVPDAEHLALLNRYIEGTATLADLFGHAYEYVTTAQERRDTEEIRAQLVHLNEKHAAETKAYNDERRRAALANIGISHEQRERQEAADFARANVELSGFKVSEEAERLMSRFVRGEITIDEAVSLLTKSKTV